MSSADPVEGEPLPIPTYRPLYYYAVTVLTLAACALVGAVIMFFVARSTLIADGPADAEYQGAVLGWQLWALVTVLLTVVGSALGVAALARYDAPSPTPPVP